MTSPEARYRRLLRLHPAGSDRDDLLATLLDLADDRGHRLGPWKTVGILLLGARRWLRVVAERARAESVDWLAPMALGSAAGLSLTALVLGELSHGPFGTRGGHEPHAFGPFLTLGVLTLVVVIAAALVASLGGSFRWLLHAAIATSIATVPLSVVVDVNRPPSYLLATLMLAVILGLPGRVLHPRQRLILVVSGAVTTLLLYYGSPELHDSSVVEARYARLSFYLDPPGLVAAHTGIEMALAAALVLVLIISSNDRLHRALALLMVGGAWSPLLLFGNVDRLLTDWRTWTPRASIALGVVCGLALVARLRPFAVLQRR